MAIFHMHAKTGTRAGGQSARAKVDYLTRGGKYRRGGDEVMHVESGNMPTWGLHGRSSRQRNAAINYWKAADTFERANGRLFKALQMALPHELSHDQDLALIRKFSHVVTNTDDGPLPYTMTIHRGGRGKKANRHWDLMLSERVNDGVPRDPALWFRRAAASPKKGVLIDPAKGGAPKTDLLKSKEWLENVRRLWAEHVNQALAEAGVAARVDHRSLADQGVDDRAPTRHVGHVASAMARKGKHADRHEQNEQIKINNAAWQAAHAEQSHIQAQAEIELQRIEALIAKEKARADRRRKRQAALQTIMAPSPIVIVPPAPRPIRRAPTTQDDDAAARRAAAWIQRMRLRQQARKRRDRARAFEPQMIRSALYRQQLLQAAYGSSSEFLARFWRIDRNPPRREVVFSQKGGRVVDKGGMIVADRGTDHEVDAVIELALIKGWQSIQFTGSDDFKARAMMEALAAGLPVAATTAHDQELRRAAWIAVFNGGGSAGSGAGQAPVDMDFSAPVLQPPSKADPAYVIS